MPSLQKKKPLFCQGMPSHCAALNCQDMYCPDTDEQRFCRYCEKWFHVTCLSTPLSDNERERFLADAMLRAERTFLRKVESSEDMFQSEGTDQHQKESASNNKHHPGEIIIAGKGVKKDHRRRDWIRLALAPIIRGGATAHGEGGNIAPVYQAFQMVFAGAQHPEGPAVIRRFTWNKCTMYPCPLGPHFL